MGLKDAIQDNVVRLAIRKVITESNKSIDFTMLISSYGSPSDLDKKLVIKIKDMGDNVGIGIQDGAMVEVSEVKNPDSIYSMDKNTFTAILLGKVNHTQAFYMGAVEADGADWFRDSILIGKIFDEVRKVLPGGKK